MGAWYLVLLLVAVVRAAPERKSGITHEDIRDAIISVAHLVQTTTQKLERHEMRERQLGDQVKRALAGLDGRERAQDSAVAALAAALARVEAKMDALHAKMELQNDREKGSYTIDTVPLQSWMSNVEGMLNKQSPGTETVLGKDQLEKMESLVNTKMDRLTETMERLEARSEINMKPVNILMDHVAVQEKWHEEAMMEMNAIRKMSYDIINSNPHADNFTKEELAKIRDGLEYLSSDRLMNLEVKLQEMARANNDFPALLKEIAELKAVTKENFSEVKFPLIELTTKIQTLAKVEQVLLENAENVLSTRRRVEFGVQEIMIELGALVKSEAKELNNTVNSRFNDISQTIMENQNFGLTNLSSKIEMEISQVWRQIGIMYQQLTESTSALGKIQKHTEQYVNGSLSTMDNMDGRVEEMKGRVSDVRENLNFLMGRLFLVTEEFKEAKKDLAVAFDNLRSTFKSVRQDAKELGPGPNPIEEQEDNSL